MVGAGNACSPAPHPRDRLDAAVISFGASGATALFGFLGILADFLNQEDVGRAGSRGLGSR